MKKNIKKALLLSLGLAFFIGCSPDSDPSSQIESVDLTKIINPDTARAAAEFDNATNGIYKGVFVSDDLTYHGVLTVNFANDSQYNAILEYGDDQSQRIGFVRVNNSPASISNVIEFRGSNAGFTLDVSDYTQPVFSDGYIDGQGVQAKLLKETSTNPVRAMLGTFTDDGSGGNNIAGTWDMLGQEIRIIQIPTPLPPPDDIIELPVINVGLVVVTKSGTMYYDYIHEPFTPGPLCSSTLPYLQPGPQAPFFSGPQLLLGVPIDEYAAPEQTSDFGGILATWSLIYTDIVGQYYDKDCNSLPSGGTWSWNGSSGNILVN